MDIIENIVAAASDTPALLLIVLISWGALGILVGALMFPKIRRNKALTALAGFGILVILILAVPLSMDMFLK